MQWKDITGYEGLYQISDTGLIRSLPRRGTFSKPHIRKPCDDGNEKRCKA